MCEHDMSIQPSPPGQEHTHDLGSAVLPIQEAVKCLCARLGIHVCESQLTKKTLRSVVSEEAFFPQTVGGKARL